MMNARLFSDQTSIDGDRTPAKPRRTPSNAESRLLSVVVPCYNDEDVIGETVNRLRSFCTEVGEIKVELIFVNDGSRDSTWDLLKRFAMEDKRIKLIGFTRNFGHQIAVTAGIDAANGDAVVLMDSDLQDPPEVIHQMIEKWKDGYDVVYGTRSDRDGESRIRLAVTQQFYRLLNYLSDVPVPLDTGDFRLMTRNVVDVLRAMPERDRFIRAMVSWVGFKQIALLYRRAPRFAGKSHYSLRKLMRLATDGILCCSTKPLQVSIAAGMISAGLSVAGILYALYLRLFTSIWLTGWTALIISILFVGGVQLICLGIVGGYVGRIYREIQRRPLYVVNEYCGFSENAPVLSRSPVVIGS